MTTSSSIIKTPLKTSSFALHILKLLPSYTDTAVAAPRPHRSSRSSLSCGTAVQGPSQEATSDILAALNGLGAPCTDSSCPEVASLCAVQRRGLYSSARRRCSCPRVHKHPTENPFHQAKRQWGRIDCPLCVISALLLAAISNSCVARQGCRCRERRSCARLWTRLFRRVPSLCAVATFHSGSRPALPWPLSTVSISRSNRARQLVNSTNAPPPIARLSTVSLRRGVTQLAKTYNALQTE